MKTPDVYLRHIQGCIQRIHEQTSGGRDDFMSSTLIQDATLRNLQVLADKKIDDDITTEARFTITAYTLNPNAPTGGPAAAAAPTPNPGATHAQ